MYNCVFFFCFICFKFFFLLYGVIDFNEFMFYGIKIFWSLGMRMNFMMKMWVYYCCRGLFYLLVFVKLRKILGKKSKKLLIF